jgi:hypothetical protein
MEICPVPSFPKLGVGENPQDPAVEMRRRRFSRNAKLVSLEVAGRDIRGVEWIPNEAKAVWFVCSGESTTDVAAPTQRRDEGDHNSLTTPHTRTPPHIRQQCRSS